MKTQEYYRKVKENQIQILISEYLVYCRVDYPDINKNNLLLQEIILNIIKVAKRMFEKANVKFTPII